MTRALEVFYLPWLFLAVTFLGGLRVVDRVVFVPPPLFALVLATLLVIALVRCRAFAPLTLMDASRPALANLNGAVVLLTLFAAAVQVFNAVVPDAGLPRLVVAVFLFLLLLNTLAASADRTHVLRGLAVTLGSTFVLKFVVLAALSDPAGGWLKRLLVAALDGVTLGTLSQQPFAAATGYLAFLTLLLFFAGLVLLPRGSRDPSVALIEVPSL